MAADPLDNKFQQVVTVPLSALEPEIIDQDDTEIGITCDVYHNRVVCIDDTITIRLSDKQKQKISNMLTERKHDNDLAHILAEEF